MNMRVERSITMEQVSTDAFAVNDLPQNSKMYL